LNAGNTIPKSITWKERWKRILYFFPIQLVLVHLKSNHLLLLAWIFITSVVMKWLLVQYGAYNLFLYPEYMGQVGPASHFIMGIAIGGFLISFNLASYALNGHKFPLIATLNRPFYKYTLNNFIIPFTFLGIYTYQLIVYQKTEELVTHSAIALHLLALYAGIILFSFIAFSYFLTTNKNFQKLFGDIKIRQEKHQIRPVRTVFSRKEKWYSILTRKKEWRVVTYLSEPWRVNLARDISHYDGDMLRTVFAQNHINATVFELLTIITILFFGFYRETPVFKLPAAVSIILMLTMIIMLVSAIYSWLKGWSTLVFVLLFFGYNWVSSMPEYSFTSFAYGLQYDSPPAPYSNQVLKDFSRDTAQITKDTEHITRILSKWKVANDTLYNQKPKLVIVNCSGGGIRASAWTMRVMQHLDSVLNGSLMQRTHFVTGSSGGMIGASYFRELHFRRLAGTVIDPTEKEYYDDVSKDILNAVALNFSLHDWLIRVQRFEYGGEAYTKDRGYAFERQLSANTRYYMEKNMFDYNLPEQEADIPIMLLSPTITNDTRKLLISSQPMSFLTQTDYLDNLNNIGLVESVDYHQLLANHHPDSLHFLSALRMNASFFYVLPNVSLPTGPHTEVMDAGIRDNYGTQHTLRYIAHFIDWINENTSGVVIIQIRDRYKTVDILPQENKSLIESIKRPVSVVSDNYLTMQTYNQDEMLMHLSGLLKNKISVVNFQLKRTSKNNIALSWHLTNKDKKRIYRSIYEPENQVSTKILERLLEVEE